MRTETIHANSERRLTSLRYTTPLSDALGLAEDDVQASLRHRRATARRSLSIAPDNRSILVRILPYWCSDDTLIKDWYGGIQH
jgi:hypothetical protein